MPDPKGEWSLKGNNSELHYGNIQKFISSSIPWSVTICQISGSYPKQFFRYFVHKVVSIQNACVWKRGISQPKIFGIGVKVNQFIYTLVYYYMANIRLLAKLVLQIFCSQGCSYTKCLCLKKGSNSTKHLRNRFKVNQFIYTLVRNYLPNIRILAKAVLQIFCSQGCSYTKCLCPKKGNNSTKNLRNRFKI